MSQEITGIASYLARLDECAQPREDIMVMAQEALAAAQAVSESEHDTGEASELADAWAEVVDALSAAGETGAAMAERAHRTYDPVLENLSGVSAPAAQQYLGDH